MNKLRKSLTLVLALTLPSSIALAGSDFETQYKKAASGMNEATYKLPNVDSPPTYMAAHFAPNEYQGGLTGGPTKASVLLKGAPKSENAQPPAK